MYFVRSASQQSADRPTVSCLRCDRHGMYFRQEGYCVIYKTEPAAEAVHFQILNNGSIL